MKQRIRISSVIVLLIASITAVSGQHRLAVGGNIGPTLCFTNLNPRLEGLQRTSPRNWDLFNYHIGANIDFELDAGLAFSSGINFGRKRFGYIHEQTIGEDAVRLWGHSELYTVTVPFEIAYAVLEGKDPYFEILPFLGISAGKDFSNYRNLTRLDENTSYTFTMQNELEDSYVLSLLGGIKLRTIIEQLGMIDWSLALGSDLTELPSFDYEITSGNAESESYSQHVKINYISAGMTLYFRSWEIINGNFMRRRY
jgi:hypothetical protein